MKNLISVILLIAVIFAMAVSVYAAPAQVGDAAVSEGLPIYVWIIFGIIWAAILSLIIAILLKR